MILVDTNVLGVLCHRSQHSDVLKMRELFRGLRDAGIDIAVPEIADYELRRSLVRLSSFASIVLLDTFELENRYLPLTTPVMRRAAALWAESRTSGRPTAADSALDGDVILAAQALEVAAAGVPALVVTTNIRHIARFVPCTTWLDLSPTDPQIAVHARRYRAGE